MYVETRTTVDEVLTDVAREVNYLANSLLSALVSQRRTPSRYTKTQLREKLSMMNGGYQVAAMVHGGVERLPEELRTKVFQAREEAKAILG